jgi:hypothetical protein
MTSTYVRAERLYWDVLPDGWMSQREIRDALRTHPLLRAAHDRIIDAAISNMATLEYVIVRREEKQERPLPGHGAFGGPPVPRRYYAFTYLKRPLKDVPLEAEVQQAQKQLDAAVVKHQVAEDAKLDAALARRAARNAATTTSTNQEADHRNA